MEVVKEILTKDEINAFCQKNFIKFVGEQLEVISFEYSNFGDTPKGFLARHRFLNVLINRKTSSKQIVQDKLKFFIKSTPEDVAKQMEYCEGFGVFKKEVNNFKYLIPHLFAVNLEKSCNYFAPKCYLAKSNLLVFENLAAQGYRLGTNRQDTILDYDHLKCALRTLALMHSSSIIFEKRMQKTIPEIYKNCIEENSYPNDPKNIRSITFKIASVALSELIKMIPKYQHLSVSEMNHLINKFQETLAKIFEFIKPSKQFRNVYSHGDLWANNLMFKYGEDSTRDGKRIPIDCRLVDFQLTRYAPPIVDVITLLTIPTSSEFRKKHLDNLLKDYYGFLEQNLSSHNIDIKNELPVSEYQASVEHYKLAGIIESCLFSHLTILPENEVSSLLGSSDNFDEFLTKKRSEICKSAFKNSEIYRDRLTDMITDLVDNYCLH